MWLPAQQLRIWLYNRPTDMRNSFDGLSALVRRELNEEPGSGQLFVFLNRRRTQMKVLYFERNGYCVWTKRLAQGMFHSGVGEGSKHRLSLTELQLIIEGIDTRKLQRFKRYKGPLS